MKRALLLVVAPVVGTVVVAWWAAAHEAPLLLGTTPQATLVPWWYQAVAFPPWFLLLGSLALTPRPAWQRASLVGVSSAVALVRLAGLIPLSGHAVFCAACVVSAWRATFPAAHAVRLTATLGLMVTMAAKLWWGDAGWFVASVLVGCGLGVVSRARASRG